MAWTKVKITLDRFGEIDANGTAQAKRDYFCEADAPFALDAALSASAGGVTVAARSEAFSGSRPRCKATKRDVERHTPTQATVHVDYSDPTGGESGTDLLALPAKFKETYEQELEEYLWDYDTTPKAVVNAAGEPFDKQPERLKHVKVYTITKYVNGTTKAAIEAAIETNNSGTITLRGINYTVDLLLLANADFEDVESNVYHATYVIKYKKGKWKDVGLNMGYSELLSGFPDGGQRRRIKEQDNAGNDVDVTKPWPLNSDGTAKTNGNDLPEELIFWPYPQAAWTGVPLT
jgi:hypothetical protein